jgi:NTP pyrophosphatase (non-canonical NTP hydrolase)
MIDNSYLNMAVLKAAIKTWGEEAQLELAQEECAELIVAINHFKRGRVDAYKVAEEIADVYLMCQELALIVGEEKVEQVIKDKIARTRERINKHDPTATGKT